MEWEKQIELKRNTVLETERLFLRPFTEGQEDEIFEIARDPDVGVHAGWKPHEDPEESRAVLNNIFIPSGAWGIRDKESGNLIGCIALERDRLRPDANSSELGYWLSSACWGRGYMTEAARAVMAFGFKELELDQMGICTSPVNKRSQRVIEKCGFIYEGTLRRCYMIYDGSIRDSRVYSLLREEYEKLPR